MKQDYRKVAVGLLWFGDRIMLAPRLKKTWTGYYAAIGGKVDEGEAIIQAMVREIKEESNFFIWYPYLLVKDCYTYPDEKVFFFESWISPHRFNEIKNTEPHKRGDWELFTKQEALKLKLIPRLKDLIKNTNIELIKKYA